MKPERKDLVEPQGMQTDPLGLVRPAIESGRSALAVDAESLPAEFFDLRTGSAGQVAQKAGNYHLRVAIFGMDFEAGPGLTIPAWSDNLRRFAQETSRGSCLRFFARREEAEAWIG